MEKERANPVAPSARASAMRGGAIRALYRETTLTVQLISAMIDQEERDRLERDDSQDRRAKQRGLVAHTTRPGIPESVEDQIKPLDSRMKSAEND